MPKTPLQAAGEAMPVAKINRRNMLTGIGAASATALTLGKAESSGLAKAGGFPTGKEVPMNMVNHRNFAATDRQIAALLADLERAIADHAAAISAKEWKVVEYAHLWPLAPEEILGGARAWEWETSRASAETNIAGEPIYRQAALLTKRLARQFRTGDQAARMLNFSVDTVDELRKMRDAWLHNEKTGKSYLKSRARFLPEFEKAIPLAEQYFAETARLREVSGIAGLINNVRDAGARIEDTMRAISNTRATTPAGAGMKAVAIETSCAAFGTDDGVLNAIRTSQWSQGVVADMAAIAPAVA